MNNQKLNKNCSLWRFQAYTPKGQIISIPLINSCFYNAKCCGNTNYQWNTIIKNQQNLYAYMRRFPEKFPLIPSSQNINLSPAQQRQMSNNWYRQFATSQAIGPNSWNFGGSYVVGSEVPYTN